jgi:hypothetical protein
MHDERHEKYLLVELVSDPQEGGGSSFPQLKLALR